MGCPTRYVVPWDTSHGTPHEILDGYVPWGFPWDVHGMSHGIHCKVSRGVSHDTSHIASHGTSHKKPSNVHHPRGGGREGGRVRERNYQPGCRTWTNRYDINVK